MMLCPTIVLAGPPFLTDDPEPVDAHSWEVNYVYAKTWRNGSSSTAIPSIDINYGLTSQIQLHAQPRYSREDADGAHQQGLDNSEVGVKYRFIDETKNNRRFMLGIYPIIQLPTGKNSLGDTRGKTQIFLPLWGQVNTGPWIFYGGAGYRLNRSPSSINSWFFGTTMQYVVSDKLRLGGEVYRESRTGAGETYKSGFNLGGTFNLTEDYHLLFSAGRGLNNIPSSNEASAYIALQAIY
jgi:hypothetical protein